MHMHATFLYKLLNRIFHVTCDHIDQYYHSNIFISMAAAVSNPLLLFFLIFVVVCTVNSRTPPAAADTAADQMNDPNSPPLLEMLNSSLSDPISAASAPEATSAASAPEATSSSAGATTQRYTSQEAINEFLDPHNRIRANLNLEPLQWSSDLALRAEDYAKQRKADCELVHSPFKYGENLFWGSGPQWNIPDTVKVWLEEQRVYDYQSNACVDDQDCGHYTQIVWKNTTHVGCAMMVCQSGDTFVTCEYEPPGNWVGEKPY